MPYSPNAQVMDKRAVLQQQTKKDGSTSGCISSIETHQAHKDENELDDIGVGHRVQASEQRVEDGYHRGDQNRVDVWQVQNHTHRPTWNTAPAK